AITVDKTASPTTIHAGDTVTYTILATNSGDTPLSDVSVTDNKCSPLTGPGASDTGADNILSPGETWTFTCSKAISVDTVNVATATGKDKLGKSVSDTDDATVDVIAPSIDVDKTASPTLVHAGDTVTYTIVATNDGDVPLYNVEVTDDKCSPLTGPGATDIGGDDVLSVGEFWVFTCSKAINEETVNVATASGDDQLEKKVTDTDDAIVKVIAPSIKVEKSASPTVIHPGDSVTYTIVATNNGNTPLYGVTVTDDKCSPLVGPTLDSGSDGVLSVGESWEFTCTKAISVDTVNTATATGRDELEQPVSDTDDAKVDVIDPKIDVRKKASATTVAPGTSVTYTIEVENTGDTDLLGVTLTDDKCSPLSAPAGDTGTAGVLSPHEIWTYTCTTVINETTVNTAVGSGHDELEKQVKDQDSATVTVVSNPPVEAEQAPSLAIVTPSKCITTKLRVGSTVSNGQLRTATLFVDGKKKATRTSGQFTINTGKYKPGIHNVKVVATLTDGRTVTTTGKFSRCKLYKSVRRISPNFTG
ncbi:MAG: DUF11 domain-containing protein, partial [Actinobacteria bacterium]|nr:DUF11 domain-containing protein [Actinomycetota bacterium]